MLKFKRTSEIFKTNGDVFCNGMPNPSENENVIDIKKCIQNFKEILSKISDTHCPIHIHKVSKNLHSAIDILKLEKEFFERFKYQCPFNKTEHYALIPIYYAVQDIEFMFTPKYEILNPSYKKMYLDTKFMWNDIFDDELPLGTIESSLMGSGYTTATYPHDGYNEFKNIVLELDNGDYLFCKIIIWYNN
jgi:hypothetical protein